MAKKQEYELVWTQGKKGSDDAFFVRANVFVIEQGFKVEFDDLDKISWHLTVYDREEPIGAARIYKGEDGGKHLGNQILSACEDKIRELAKGPAVAHLSAQVRAKGFYRKNGYVESGEEYLDEYCPHISMSKQL